MPSLGGLFLVPRRKTGVRHLPRVTARRHIPCLRSLSPAIALPVYPTDVTFPETLNIHVIYYCIVFIHFYSASHSMSLSEALPTIAIDTVSEFTRRNATGNCK